MGEEICCTLADWRLQWGLDRRVASIGVGRCVALCGYNDVQVCFTGLPAGSAAAVLLSTPRSILRLH